jgi:hypothetical protein
MRTDRPEDIANREYYANMPTRRARVVVEVDVEWREDEPEYSFDVLNLGEMDSIRVRNLEVKDVSWADAQTAREGR